MRSLAPLALLAVVACASAPPPPVVKPMFVDGVLQRELTPQDAERYLRQAVPEFEKCYRTERLNLADAVSSYIVSVKVPTDGTPATVEVLKETMPKQVVLRDCILSAIKSVKFPAHIGDPLTLKVPIEGS